MSQAEHTTPFCEECGTTVNLVLPPDVDAAEVLGVLCLACVLKYEPTGESSGHPEPEAHCRVCASQEAIAKPGARLASGA